MRKKILIDLNGIVFEPVETKFSDVANAEFGRTKAAALNIAYRYGIGRGILKNDIAGVLNKCTQNPTLRPGVIEALEKIAALPGVSIEFYGQLAFPEQAAALEAKYRAIAPAMNGNARYNIHSPFESNRGYLFHTTGKDEMAMNYILGTQEKDMSWPTKWRIIPVLIQGMSAENDALARICGGKRTFGNMGAFADFLAHRR